MTSLEAPAKINLALVVGPPRSDGKHAIVTVFERLELADRIALEPASRLDVAGFPDDTLVRAALEALAERAGVEPAWAVAIEKHVPVAAGLGGGSSDAAAALRLANATLDEPLGASDLHELASTVGADVPFFLTTTPQLGQGDGTALSPLALPRGYHVVLVLPTGAAKTSTMAVYDAFDARRGEAGFEERRRGVLEALAAVKRPRDLAALPTNDLAESPLSAELERLGAFRADVTGAGPAVYGLFDHEGAARFAAGELAAAGRVWVTAPAWYG